MKKEIKNMHAEIRGPCGLRARRVLSECVSASKGLRDHYALRGVIYRGIFYAGSIGIGHLAIEENPKKRLCAFGGRLDAKSSPEFQFGICNCSEMSCFCREVEVRRVFGSGHCGEAKRTKQKWGAPCTRSNLPIQGFKRPLWQI
jgi:hypothetical protein